MVHLKKRGPYFETLSSSYLRKVAEHFEAVNVVSLFVVRAKFWTL